jgi:hypothetical protein
MGPKRGHGGLAVQIGAGNNRRKDRSGPGSRGLDGVITPARVECAGVLTPSGNASAVLTGASARLARSLVTWGQKWGHGFGAGGLTAYWSCDRVVEERRPCRPFVLLWNIALERVLERPGHVAGQPVGEAHWAAQQTQAQRRDVRQHCQQAPGWLVLPGAHRVLGEACGERRLCRCRDARAASRQELADIKDVARERGGEQQGIEGIIGRGCTSLFMSTSPLASALAKGSSRRHRAGIAHRARDRHPAWRDGPGGERGGRRDEAHGGAALRRPRSGLSA